MKSRRRPYAEQRPQDLGGGVWSVPVPIPGNPLGYTLVYALESPKGPVLVDAGWNHPDAWDALSGGLATLGIDVSTVSGVVVTHFHPDHAGLAGQVKDVSGAWIAMHEADAALVRLMHDYAAEEHESFQSDMLRRAGADPGEARQAVSRPTPPALPDRRLRDGDLVDLPGRKLRAVHTPGHTPGHICLHLEDADRLFTGDHVLPDITPHVGIYPYDRDDVDPLGDFLDSLDRVAELGPLDALPAHEWIFPDVAARAAQIRHHHDEKLVRLRALLAQRPQPLTIWEVAAMMTWNRPWDDLSPMLKGMAAGEAAAHLRTLEARGEVRRVPGVDLVRFQALDS
ncbi:MBL fold metallo-hydrolase [Nonomuraea angiospora]|uniref:Glyoxylase-like metal-dependent hydrolase (Beta-lactamase superfamily II) n=1 Tax=Nonomuraea angiospora TaxID=46172 RepID=A0ABR9M4X6_9ACTN|nr:MBL fold metallo-hydrolase [Nonomuraea angiospora]MBE1587351.1 glyoxylase-like metal-dependent hydrolase (beta-lactamase superfamily II) [Nonomuraea angiospora]